MGFDGYWAAYNFHHENYDSYYFKDKPKKIKYNKPYEPEAQFDLAMDLYLEMQGGDNNPLHFFEHRCTT